MKAMNDTHVFYFVPVVFFKTGYDESDSLQCINIDECVTDRHHCSSDAHCNDTIGSYMCECESGFSGDGFNCIDIDECEANPCSVDGNCTNSQGSYEVKTQMNHINAFVKLVFLVMVWSVMT